MKRPKPQPNADSDGALAPAPNEFRLKAEALMRQAPGQFGELPPGEITRLFHELQVHQIELQMQNERLTIDRSEIQELRQGTLSLMPDGLLETLSEDDVRDLTGYLMHPQQVPLPTRQAQAQ